MIEPDFIEKNGTLWGSHWVIVRVINSMCEILESDEHFVKYVSDEPFLQDAMELSGEIPKKAGYYKLDIIAQPIIDVETGMKIDMHGILQNCEQIHVVE